MDWVEKPFKVGFYIWVSKVKSLSIMCVMDIHLKLHSMDCYSKIYVALMLNSALDSVCELLEAILCILSSPMFS